MKKTVKISFKMTCFLLAVFLVLPLTACKHTVQLEDRNYVMALGLDAEGNKLKAAFSFPDLEALTGKGGNIHYPVMTVIGNNLDEIEQSYRRMSSRRLDYGQLQVIVFGRKLLANKPMMETVLAYMKTRPSFTRTILVCQAKETAEEIIGLDACVNGSIGIYIREMFENNAAPDGYEKTIINDLMIAWKDDTETVPMAVLSAEGEGDEKVPKICGIVSWP